jgi:DNA primase
MPAVTSTSGSGTFPEEWIKKFEQKQVYICMDNDDAGKRAAVRLLFLLPDAAIIPLPKDVGAHGDITDWRMQNLDKTFATLLARAYKFHPPFTLPDTLAGTIHQQSILRQMNIHFELRWVQDMALDILQMQREDLAYKEKKPKKKSNVDYTDKINAARAVPLDYFFKGQKPKRVNGKLFYKCPFHNEQTASFLVDNKNKFHCFGCGVHGDAIDFVQKFSNVDWHEAVKILTGEGIIV